MVRAEKPQKAIKKTISIDAIKIPKRASPVKVFRCNICRVCLKTISLIESHCIEKHGHKDKWMTITRRLSKTGVKSVESNGVTNEEFQDITNVRAIY